MENIIATKEELMRKFQVRKSKKQKTDFINYVEGKCKSLGYTTRVEAEKGIINSRNIVVGDVDNANIVFAAHYDTCAWSPFPNMIWLKNPVAYCLYQIFLTCAIVAIGFIVSLLVAFCVGTADYTLYVFEAVAILTVVQMMFGIRNKRTANDNTSGVLTLLTIMKKLPTSKRKNVAFVFFDNEEKGLVGSKVFSKAHQMKDKFVINFDCVGEGEHVFFIHNKSTEKRCLNLLKASLLEDDKHGSHIAKGGFLTFPSDQLHFPNGIGIATVKKFALGGYMVGRLHTGRDKILDENNIDFLARWACGLAECFGEK